MISAAPALSTAATLATPYSAAAETAHSQGECRGRAVKNPSESNHSWLDSDEMRERFARMLWLAFPSPSENDLAQRAGPVLGVHPRTIKNYLRCTHEAGMGKFLIVAGIIGFETTVTMIYGRGERIR